MYPDIQSITLRVQDLSSRVDFWNRVMLWALLFAAIAALASTLATRFIVVGSRRLTEAQTELAIAKEAQLSLQLKQKDVDIAAANERAKKAERGVEEAQRDIAVSMADAARATEAAETEKLARVKIEERLAWRRISKKTHDEFVEALKPFAGSVSIVSGFDNADIESKTFATDLATVFRDSNWSGKLDLSNTNSSLPVGLVCHIDQESNSGKTLARLVRHLPDAVILPLSQQGVVAVITVGLRPPP